MTSWIGGCIIACIFWLGGCYTSGQDSYDAFVLADLLVEPVGNEACTHSVCDINPQCGCPPGYMCTIAAGVGRVCAPAGSLEDGAACEYFECAPGYLCDRGICRHACSRDSDCLQDGGCFRRWEGEGQGMCNTRCNLATNEGCPAQYHCISRRPYGYEYSFSDCYPGSGAGTAFDPCYYDPENPFPDMYSNPHSDCAPGYICCCGGDNSWCDKICTNPYRIDPACEAITEHDIPCCGPELLFIDGISYGVCGSRQPNGTCQP